MSGAVTVGVAAIAIGTAVATEFATFAVIAAVGATVSAIGALAKVKELQYAGAAIGVVGAVGGLASAAGVFGAEGVFGSGGTIFGGASGGAASVGSAAEGVESLANMAPAVADAGNAGVTGAVEIANGATPSIFQQVVGGLNNVGAPGATPEIASASLNGSDVTDLAGYQGEDLTPAGATGSADGQAVINDALPGSPATPSAPSVSVDPEANVSGFGSGQGPSGPSLVNSGATPVTGTVDTPTAESLINAPNTGNIAKADSIWKDIWSFAKDNKSMVSGTIQAGASFLSGALNPLTDAQQKALEANAKANQAAANRANAESGILNNQLANMQGSIPTASRVTGRPTGLVNQGSPVTGVPA